MAADIINQKVPPPDFIARAKGRTVKVTLLNGTEITGVIDGYTRYEVRVKTEKCDLLLFKHSIQMIDGNFSRKEKNNTEEAKK